MTAARFRRQEDVQASVRFFTDVNVTVWSASAPSSRPSRPFQSPPAGPTVTGGSGSYFARSFNSNVVVAMVVMLLAVVVAAFVNTVARYVLRRRRLQLPEAQNGAADKGLGKSVIEALPVVAYGAESLKSVFDPAGDNVCVVCLSEFVREEKLRLLPECQHGFHVGCIDAWLATHKTCPVCRRNVVSGESEADLSRARPVAVAGSSRFGSAQIASVDIEIHASGQSASESAAAAASSESTSRPTRWFRSMLPTYAMAIIIHGALGSRRFSPRSQGRV